LLQEIAGGEMASRECPNCHSKRNWKDGFRKTDNGSVQRYLCQDCAFRFSDNPYKLKSLTGNSQLCAELEAKKLDTATEIKTVAGEIGKSQQEIEVKIVQFDITLKNKGRTTETRRTYTTALYTLIKKGANILDPESVEETIAKQEKWTIRAKRNYTDWYSRFAKFLHLDWEKPLYKASIKVPFIPLEAEIDQLIAGCPRKSSIALQIAKETAARKGEITRIQWIDIDFEANRISINQPEKGSNCGIYQVSKKLIERILTLPRTSGKIFGDGAYITDSLENMLIRARNRLAESLCNPKLRQIHFHTLRHWAITNYAHKVKDPFLVQQFARHKDMKCTMRYVHLESIVYQRTENDAWTVRAAKTAEEAMELLKVGFDYVTEFEGLKLFRKRN
jgi:integrase